MALMSSVSLWLKAEVKEVDGDVGVDVAQESPPPGRRPS